MNKDRLHTYLEQQSSAPVPKEVTALYESFCQSLIRTEAVAAGIFYGSALWKAVEADSVWDLYVLIDNYAASTLHPLLRIAGTCLPPNVYYHEVYHADKPVIRGKIAVMTLAQFEAHCRGRSLSAQTWARFAQPVRIISARDSEAKFRIISALRNAVVTFHNATAPWVDDPCSIEIFWYKGFKRTYASEFRTERADRLSVMIAASQDAFITRTTIVLSENAACPLVLKNHMVHSRLSKRKRRLFRGINHITCILSKANHLLRLMKAVFTFSGGIDYLAYKIERHSGIKLTPTPFQRRYPLIGAWGLFIRGLRMRAFR